MARVTLLDRYRAAVAEWFTGPGGDYARAMGAGMAYWCRRYVDETYRRPTNASPVEHVRSLVAAVVEHKGAQHGDVYDVAVPVRPGAQEMAAIPGLPEQGRPAARG